MKPAPFEYVRANSRSAALEALASSEEEVRILAGGQSLMPLLNMRMSMPARLVDINRLSELAELRLEGGRLRIGALVRHRRIETDPLIARTAPLLRLAAPHVAHRAIRNRGTFGGSLALADPAAEFPACALALDAEIVLETRGGSRAVPANSYFKGIYETEMQPDELLTEVILPPKSDDSRHGFAEIARRHGDYALAGLAAASRRDGARLSDLRLAFFGIADRPVLALRTASILQSEPLSAPLIAAAADCLQTEIRFVEDIHGSIALRQRLAGVVLGRVLDQIAGREAAGGLSSCP